MFWSTPQAAASNVLPSQFLVAGLPPAADNARKYAWVTDLHDGQPDYVISDGTNWKPVRPLAARMLNNPASNVTLQALASAPTQIIKSLTASRTVILSPAMAYSGARFRVKKEATGLLTATVVGLVNTILPSVTPGWADYEWSAGDGGWVVTASGGLL